MFPATASGRQEAANGGARGKYSPLFRCGYSPDIEGGAGNFAGEAPFTTCDYSKGQCEERGMYRTDGRGQTTARFGGIQYLPPSIEVRTHGEDGRHIGWTIDNAARYNDVVPLVYGAAWYEPPIIFARNDGNLTHLEALLGMGEMSAVIKVIANGVEVPAGQAGADMTGTGWFNIVSLGSRNGAFNADFHDANGNPAGDPYGGMAVLSVVLPNRISDGRTLPKIEVLAEGMKLPRYGTDGNSLGEQFSNNPAWVILDLLRRSGWELSEIDVASFARTAQYCDELIQASDLHGNPVSVPRYQCNLVVRRRRSAAVLRLSALAKACIGPTSTRTSALGGCCRGYPRARPGKPSRNVAGPDRPLRGFSDAIPNHAICVDDPCCCRGAGGHGG